MGLFSYVPFVEMNLFGLFIVHHVKKASLTRYSEIKAFPRSYPPGILSCGGFHGTVDSIEHHGFLVDIYLLSSPRFSLLPGGEARGHRFRQ
jgi:hypothetical protein